MKTFNRDEKHLIEIWKQEHGEAMRKGHFSKANVLQKKLEIIGETGDFESTFEPQTK